MTKVTAASEALSAVRTVFRPHWRTGKLHAFRSKWSPISLCGKVMLIDALNPISAKPDPDLDYCQRCASSTRNDD